MMTHSEKQLLGPEVWERARALAAEAHERVFQAVQGGGVFASVYRDVMLAARRQWLETELREVADLALDLGCDTLDLQDRILEAKKARRWGWWR